MLDRVVNLRTDNGRTVGRVAGGWTVNDAGQCWIAGGVWRSAYLRAKQGGDWEPDVFPTLEGALHAALTVTGRKTDATP